MPKPEVTLLREEWIDSRLKQITELKSFSSGPTVKPSVYCYSQYAESAVEAGRGRPSLDLNQRGQISSSQLVLKALDKTKTYWLNPGVEPCLYPPKPLIGKLMYLALRKEWRRNTAAETAGGSSEDDYRRIESDSSQEYDLDRIEMAIEDTPGIVLRPSVPLHVILDILTDIWDDSCLYC